jgi:hypothetical protein
LQSRREKREEISTAYDSIKFILRMTQHVNIIGQGQITAGDLKFRFRKVSGVTGPDSSPSVYFNQLAFPSHFKMDPTLAPDYVAPPTAQVRVPKGHHWAEIRKIMKSEGSSNKSQTDRKNKLTSSNNASRPRTSDGVNPPAHKRIRMEDRGARASLSDGEGIGGPADLEEVPIGVKRQALSLDDYAFPTHRLRTVMDGTHSFISHIDI